MRYQVRRAMNHLQGLDGFDQAFREICFKRVQKEADDGCRAIALTEVGPSNFQREVIDSLDMEVNYERLCSTFPTLMAGMVAVATKERCYDSAIKVFTFTQTILCRGSNGLRLSEFAQISEFFQFEITDFWQTI